MKYLFILTLLAACNAAPKKKLYPTQFVYYNDTMVLHPDGHGVGFCTLVIQVK